MTGSILKTSRWRRHLAVLLVLLVLPAAALAASQRPSASFSFAPENPRSGDAVRFVSSACDPGGRLVGQAWDLDGDGQFDDAEGPAAGATFSSPGTHVVALQVTDSGGATDVQRRTVTVDTPYALPRPDASRLMSPFPVVTMAGRLTDRGARIKMLAVRAPVCSLVDVSCRGRCPVKHVSTYVGRSSVRIRGFERRFAAGTVLTVRISKGNLIGKFTEFRVRSGAPPKRRDMCLKPGASAGSRCPRD